MSYFSSLHNADPFFKDNTTKYAAVKCFEIIITNFCNIPPLFYLVEEYTTDKQIIGVRTKSLRSKSPKLLNKVIGLLN